jgi:hypothetical protein
LDSQQSGADICSPNFITPEKNCAALPPAFREKVKHQPNY